MKAAARKPAKTKKAVKKVLTPVAKKAAARKKAPIKPKPKPKTKQKQKPAKRETGRPSLYGPVICAAICGWVRQGYTLRQIESLANMPCKATIIQWLGEHEDFSDQYARAHETRALLMADEMVEIGDDARNDWMEREGKDGKVEVVFNPENVARAKVRIDARKFLMVKLAPKRFGDRLKVDGKLSVAAQEIGSIIDLVDGAGTGLPDNGSTD